MLAHDSYGGLEHRASSVNLFHPHFAATRKAYEGLLELLSHELFHAWNGKRIAPRPLFEVDYAREAYTPCLWLMEGLTSHYDRFALRSAGRITAKSYLEKVLDDWARLQATPGRARQSLEQSSFDAWIKLYKPDESNLNTTVSYYLKGGLVMFALDLQIRRRTEGARSLDDVLRLLWQRYGQPGEPHPDDLQPLFEEATGLALGDVFARQIRGTEDPELARELAHVGLELRASTDPAQTADGLSAVWLGATVQGNRVTAVFDHGPAQRAGISPGDELVAIDRFRATSDGELRNLLGTRRVGETVEISAFRRHRLIELRATLAAAPPTRYELVGSRALCGNRTVPDVGRRAAPRCANSRHRHDHGTVGMTLLDSSTMKRLCLVLPIGALVAALALAAGCDKKSSDHGLAPAQNWGADPTGGSAMPAAGPHAAGANPHAGIDMSGTPPQDVVDENGNNPHAGLAGGSMDVSNMGALAPDPNRPIDPSHHIRGLIKVHPKAADRAKPGTAIFVIVKQADASGQPTGTPLAVDKLTWQGKDLPFELTESQAMIKGTQLTGDVVVTARYDQDGDAISKQPGDITGQVRVKVPVEDATLYLDTILP